MKMFLYTLFSIALFCTACKTKQEAPKVGELFTITGSINKFPFDTVYLGELKRVDSLPIIVDSALLKSDGNIKLSATSSTTNLFAIYVKETMPNGAKGLMPVLFFVNDSKDINFKMDWESRKTYTIGNSAESENLKQYFDKIDSITTWQRMASKTMDSLQKKKAKDTASLLAINNKFEGEFVNFSSQLKAHFDKVSFGNLANFYFMIANRTNALTLEDKNDLMLSLSKKFPDAMATPAPDFTMEDPMGKKISLSQFRGKYVLVDFWASWCQPCRMENPNVVNAYNKFKDRNFTILGVSLDDDAEAWKLAIQQDKLTWPHMSDLKGWESPIVPTYQFEGIPHNVLVDPNGNIVASKLRGPDLEKTLELVLPKK